MRVAVVGMDGTGKTTAVRRLADGGGVSAVYTIRPHDDPASPDAELSRHLALASAAADAVGRAQLKVAVFARQLLLYGPAERRALGLGLAAPSGAPGVKSGGAEARSGFTTPSAGPGAGGAAERVGFSTSFEGPGAGSGAAPVVLADRHPLIDPLVYLPLYARIGVDEDPRSDVERWRSSLPPATVAALGDEDYWSLGTDLIRLAAKPSAELLAELVRRFGVALPDAVVLLDLPVGVALRRARARSGGEAEIHETDRVLSAIRSGYDSVLRWLGDTHPETRVRRIDCNGRSADEVANALAAAIRD